jgi:hypothetical protein
MFVEPTGLRVAESEAFTKLVQRTFEDADTDKDGYLELSELYVAILKL